MKNISLRYMAHFCELTQTPQEDRAVPCENFRELIAFLDASYPGFAREYYNLIGERHECTLRRPEQAAINPLAEEPVLENDCYGFY